jgi:glycosyltransferase involved in cell wall biosynthesis
MCGLANAGGEWIVTMDDDLQFLPEDISGIAGLRKSNPSRYGVWHAGKETKFVLQKFRE